MFKFTFSVSDQDFAKIYRQLKPVQPKLIGFQFDTVEEVTVPKPLKKPLKKKGAPRAKPMKPQVREPDSGTIPLLKKFLADNRLTEVTTQDLIRIGGSFGKSKFSVYNAITSLTVGKFLTRIAPGKYSIGTSGPEMPMDVLAKPDLE